MNSLRLDPFAFLFCSLILTSVGFAAEEPERPIYEPPVSVGSIGDFDLGELTGKLISTLEEMHVETGPENPQFGLVYETYDPERKIWVEGEGRDTMHHMMWTMAG